MAAIFIVLARPSPLLCVYPRLEISGGDVIRYSILEIIGANPGTSQITVSSARGIERVWLVALLDELQQLDLLVRQRSITDRRLQELRLPLGKATLKTAIIAVADHEAQLVQRFGAENYKMPLSALSDFRSE